MGKRIIEEIEIDNPSLTDGLAEGNAAGETNVPERIAVPHNLVLMIGGFARVHERTPLQTLAAKRYRDLWEASRIAGARAIDYGVVRVDSSGGGDVLERGEDARRAYAAAVQAIGLRRSRLVELVVCEEASIRRAARMLEGGDGDAARKRIQAALVAAAETLVSHFGLRARREGDGRIAAEGELPDLFTGIIATRKVPC